ncbi:MAG: MFS transporter [Pseudomonadota bacterium]
MTLPAVKRRTIRALIFGMLIYSLGMGTTYPLLGLIIAEQATGSWNGLHAGATGLGLLVGVFMAPPLCRWIGAGPTVIAGVALMAASLLAMATVAWSGPPDFWALFVMRVALGCGANLMFVVAETALNGLAPPAQRGRVMGIYSSAVAFGFVVGPGVVALASEAAAQVLLACAAITAIAMAPIASARRPVSGVVSPVSAIHLPRAVSAAPFAFAFLVVASAVDTVAISLFPVIALAQHFTAAEGALLVGAFHFGLLLGQPFVGVLLDAIGRLRTVLACTLVSLGCAMAMVFGGSIGFLAVCGFMIAWGGANYGLYTAGLAMLGDRFKGAALTAATAAFAAVYALASISAPVFAGAVLDAFGPTGIYLGAALIYFAVMLAGVLAFRPDEPTLTDQWGARPFSSDR